MANKITKKYLKLFFTIEQKCIKQKKGLRAYARALVYVADTVDIIFANFAWTVIDIAFL